MTRAPGGLHVPVAEDQPSRGRYGAACGHAPGAGAFSGSSDQSIRFTVRVFGIVKGGAIFLRLGYESELGAPLACLTVRPEGPFLAFAMRRYDGRSGGTVDGFFV